MGTPVKVFRFLALALPLIIQSTAQRPHQGCCSVNLAAVPGDLRSERVLVVSFSPCMHFFNVPGSPQGNDSPGIECMEGIWGKYMGRAAVPPSAAAVINHGSDWRRPSSVPTDSCTFCELTTYRAYTALPAAFVDSPVISPLQRSSYVAVVMGTVQLWPN